MNTRTYISGRRHFLLECSHPALWNLTADKRHAERKGQQRKLVQLRKMYYS